MSGRDTPFAARSESAEGAGGGAPKDNRTAPRRRVLKSAVIAYSGRHCTLPCSVRDVSSRGARLKVADPLLVPDTFELIIELDGLEADCRVVSRRAGEIGVRFASPPRQGLPRRQQVLEISDPKPTPTLRKQPRHPAGS